MTASPNTISSTGPAITIGDNTFYLYTTLVSYNGGPNSSETITVTVAAATCDCNKARWTVPSVATRIVTVDVPLAYTFNTLTIVNASVNSNNSTPNADTVEMRAC